MTANNFIVINKVFTEGYIDELGVRMPSPKQIIIFMISTSTYICRAAEGERFSLNTFYTDPDGNIRLSTENVGSLDASKGLNQAVETYNREHSVASGMFRHIILISRDDWLSGYAK